MKVISALLALALVSACDRSDPNICGSLAMRFPGVATTADDQKQVLYSCMERWAARLSRSSRDSASEVAKAAVAACENSIVYYNYYLNKEARVPLQATDYPKESFEKFWIERATFIAVQARAGNCYSDA